MLSLESHSEASTVSAPAQNTVAQTSQIEMVGTSNQASLGLRNVASPRHPSDKVVQALGHNTVLFPGDLCLKPAYVNFLYSTCTICCHASLLLESHVQ